MDGSKNSQGSDIGVILKTPNDIILKSALHFLFKTTNNKAEYEVLLAKLKLA